MSPSRIAALAALALVAAAAPALATHTGQPIPEGTVVLFVPMLDLEAGNFAESPLPQVDEAMGEACAETQGGPTFQDGEPVAYCTYTAPACARKYAYVMCGPPLLPLLGPAPDPGWPALPIPLPHLPALPPLPPVALPVEPPL